MHIAVVGNVGDDDDGLVGARMAHYGATFARYHREDPRALRRCEEEADLLVLLGSDWSVYDLSHSESVRAEQALVRRAQLRGLPILGICFGGQLISSTLGLIVAPSDAHEIGWRMLETDDEAACPSGPWFQYHFDRWSDAGDIHSIARTPAGPQAYWYGRTLALQFHPEVTPEIVERWLSMRREELIAIGVDLDQVMVETKEYTNDAEQRCNALVDQFFASADSARYPAQLS